MQSISERERARRAEQSRRDRLISRREAANQVGLSISSLKRLEAAGLFPKKIKITAGRVGYLEGEVGEWIAARVAERDAAAIR